MASIYVCDVIGTGARTDPYRAAIADLLPQDSTTLGHTVLMIDTVRGKAIVYTADDTIAGTGITRILQAANRQALITALKTTQPNAARRTTMNTWLTNAGYPTIPAQLLTWYDILHAAARFVNPGASIDATGVG